MIDEWSGFADLMASLIEKYAADLDLDNLPDPKNVLNQQDDVSMSEKIVEPCIADRKAAWYNDREMSVQTKFEKGKTFLNLVT